MDIPFKVEIIVYDFFSKGLIHLPQKVEILEDIQAVRMPNKCDSTENIEVIAIGHGGTENNSTFSSQLNFAALKTLPAKECRKALPVILFRKSVICASNDMRKQSIFDGDSGGPLVRASDGILIGISSFLQASKFILVRLGIKYNFLMRLIFVFSFHNSKI